MVDDVCLWKKISERNLDYIARRDLTTYNFPKIIMCYDCSGKDLKCTYYQEFLKYYKQNDQKK